MATKTYTAPTATVPTGVAVANVGAAGAVTYGYRISALHGAGETTASTTVTTTTGNATLNGSNYNTVTWNAVPGATSYNVYGRTSGTELKLANVVATASAPSYNDQGTATPAGALPAANTAVLASDSVGWTVKTIGRALDRATREGIAIDTHGSLQELATGAAAINP